MRIKILRTVGRKDTVGKTSENPTSLELPAKPDGTMYQEGEVANFSSADAEKFIKSGVGEETDEPVGPPPKPVVNAIPTTVVPLEETQFAPPKPVMAKKPASPVAASEDYDSLTVEELHKEAADRQLEGRSALTTKADLVKALKKDDAKGK